MVRADPVAWGSKFRTGRSVEKIITMKKTDFARCLDSVGRLVIPSKLRTQLNLENGYECAFYIHEINGETYLCIKCPKQETELEKAIRIITANGMKICDI